MVYAHQPERSNGLANTGKLWDALREANRIVALFMQSYISDTPQDCTPLQAADLWAYELGHHFERIRPSAREARWPFRQFVGLGLNYGFTHDFISYHDKHGLNGLGKMSRVQRWGEIDLYKPGFNGLHPTEARKFDQGLRKIGRFVRSSIRFRKTFLVVSDSAAPSLPRRVHLLPLCALEQHTEKKAPSQRVLHLIFQLNSSSISTP